MNGELNLRLIFEPARWRMVAVIVAALTIGAADFVWPIADDTKMGIAVKMTRWVARGGRIVVKV